MTGGTTHINNLIGQALIWALVLAVGAFIGYGIAWAVGSLAANANAAGKGKSGMIICLAAALLLGCGLRLISWSYDTEARNFQADPASYVVDDSPKGAAAFTVLDRTDAWSPQINSWRTEEGNPAVTTESGLRTLAQNCASLLAGSTGACPNNHQYDRYDYGPADLGRLSGALLKGGIFANMPRVMVSNATEVALVAVTNNAKKSGTLVVVAASQACGACTIGKDGFVQGLIVSIKATG